MELFIVLAFIIAVAALAPVLGVDSRDLDDGPRLLGDRHLPPRHSLRPDHRPAPLGGAR